MAAEEHVSLDDIARLAELQASILPASLISELGPNYLRAFYKYLVRSRDELLFLQRDEFGKVAAGCVISLDVRSLERRLALKTPLLFAALGRPGVLMRAVRHGGQPPIIQGAELILLFCASEFRRRGYAATLVSRTEVALSRRRIRAYQVRTFDDPSDAAFKFYLSLGFEKVGSFNARGYRFALMKRQVAE
jgi:ribosomal protein S18 acetylase RimI-like enzyme